MWFKHRGWIPVAWLLSLGNLAAVWFAAQPAEPWHATIHAVLAVGFAIGARHLATRRRATVRRGDEQQSIEENEHLRQALEGMQPRLQELEERVDFAERLLAKQREAERRGLDGD